MSKENVLIVDDERDVLDLCKRILATQGYQVTTANNGYEAIEVARNKSFDLLLTDIKMPGMSGLDIAQALKESDPGMICVTMTGFATMDAAIKALSLGIDEFILKPFTPKDLVRGINKALEKEHLRKENVRLRSLVPLFELNKTLIGNVEVNGVLSRLLEIAQDVTRADFGRLYIMKDSNASDEYFLFEDKNETTADQQEASDHLIKSIIDTGDQLVLQPDKPAKDHQAFMEQFEAECVIATPLKSQQSLLGVLILGRTNNKFAPSDSEFLSVLCGQAGVALENARAYQKLQTLDHMKSEFINIAAHELRTPLSILLGYASILEEDANEENRDYVANIIRNGMRLRTLIDDMLNLKKLEAGVVTISQNKLNLKETVEQIAQDLALLLDKKHQLEISVPTDFPELVADQQKVELILVNILHNAFKFTPEGEQIAFKAAANGKNATMSLYNSNTFIPADEQERIFDQFYQVESSLTREHGGAGLGLAIVRGMIEVCGGEISVESHEEEGTTFIFSLPLDNAHLEGGKLRL